MSAAEEKILKTLEFPAVRDILKRYCVTSIGKSVAARLRPFDRLDKAARALKQVVEMKSYLSEGGKITLAGACDAVKIIDGALEKNQCIDPKDLHALGAFLSCARLMKTSLAGPMENRPELSALLDRILDLESLEGELKRTVDANGRVLSTASPRLQEIRNRMERLTEEIRRRAESILRNREVARTLQDENIMFRNNRFVLPVRIECRKKVRGILHDYSSSGNTAFIEPEALVEKQNELEKERHQESKEINLILWERTRTLLDAHEDIRTNQRIVAWMDFTRCRALYAMDYDLHCPELSPESVLILREARHPLLLEMAFTRTLGSAEERRAAAYGEVIPFDIHLGDRFDVLVVTGPNTGGKTVLLKTAGLLALMMASGLHIPSREGSRIPFFKVILADIGDEQDLSQSLSTFSSHMQRISEILVRADAMTLVLLDELGSGTDPLEGEALGRGILNYLLACNTKVLVSTHLSKLKEFAYSSDRVENGSMEFDPDTLHPTYRLRIGIPGESNALRIARRLGIPQAILDEAGAALEMENRDMKELMDDVQRVRIETEKTLEQSKIEAQTVLKLRKEAEAREQEVAFRQSVLENETEREIDNYLRKSRDQALHLIKELKNLPAPYKKPIEDLEQVLNQMIERSPLGVKRRRFLESLKKGDMVYIPRYRERCRVIRIYKKEDMIEVAYRNLSVKVPSEEIIWPHWY
jgi:DNA mismatch repair protein MutS2